MQDIEHTEQLNGYTIRIMRDIYCHQSPADEGDDSVFLVGYHNDFFVESKEVTKDEVRNLFMSPSELEKDELARRKEIEKQFHVFGLEAYIHSGVVLALRGEGGFPDRQWDVSQLGAVFVSRKEARTEKQARTIALAHIKYWNNYLSGNVYGFHIVKMETCKCCGHTNEEIVDSAWGFNGDMEESGVLEEARASVPKK